jgi:hypothetical protein
LVVYAGSGAGTLFWLGWSTNGRIAFIEQYHVGGPCGFCPFYDFVVFDLVEDKVVFEKSYEAGVEVDDSPAVMQFGDFWNANWRYVTEECARYGIWLRPAQLLPGPEFSHAGRSYSLGTEALIATRPFTGFEFSTEAAQMVECRVGIYGAGLGMKAIFWRQESELRGTTGIEVIGVFISPFEDRAAVLCRLMSLDADGFPAASFLLIGAHLTFGYSAEIPVLRMEHSPGVTYVTGIGR